MKSLTGGLSRRSTTGKSANGDAEAEAYAQAESVAPRGCCKLAKTPPPRPTGVLLLAVTAWRDTRLALEKGKEQEK